MHKKTFQLVAGTSLSATPRRLVQMYEYPRAGSDPVRWIMPVFSLFKVNEVKNPYEWAPHTHTDDFEVIIVDRGIYQCSLNDHTMKLKPGEVLVVKPGDRHADTCQPRLRYLSVSFFLDRELLGKEAARLFRSTATPEQQRVRIERRLFWPIFDRIRGEAGTSDRFSACVLDALLAEFFWRLLRVLPRDAVCPEFIGLSEDQDFRAEMRLLFERQIRGGLSVADMARHMGMSTSSFAHKCKTLTGVSPAHAFMRCKIERAQSLLKMTDLPVKEIGTHLGFQNPHHFLRTFKRYSGKTPSAFRAQP